jgi:4'-phosphopantetheinyl transferase
MNRPMGRSSDWIQFPDPGSCHVWWARPGDANPRLLSLLDSDERQRLQALRRQPDRDRFLTACGLMRLALSQYVHQPPSAITVLRTCPICSRPHGKPRLTSGLAPIELSVSHAGDRVAVAIAWRTPIGVDVEQIRADLPVDELISQTLTPEEAKELDDLCGTGRVVCFLTYWTRKEAVVKAIGRGLAEPLRSFSVTRPDEPPRITTWPAAPELAGRLSLHDLHPGDGHLATLAVIGDCRQVDERDGSALLATGPLS